MTTQQTPAAKLNTCAPVGSALKLQVCKEKAKGIETDLNSRVEVLLPKAVAEVATEPFHAR